MSKSEIKILEHDIFICSFCGERISKEETCYLIQDSNKTEIRHECCLEENLK
jgi:hypothetical protein